MSGRQMETFRQGRVSVKTKRGSALCSRSQLRGGRWRNQVDLTPEFFPRQPVGPESQRGRFWCVHIGVNDHQQGCQQPPQCFYNGILIHSPHHPAELKSAPVCLFLVRLLLKMGNREQRLCFTYLWGHSHSLGQTPSQVPQQLFQCRHPPGGHREKKPTPNAPLERGRELATAAGTLPQAQEAAVSPGQGL